MKRTPQRLLILSFLALFVYLSLYTWNLRTGYFDALATQSGLEFVGVVLGPGKWAKARITGFWDRYLGLVGVRERNEALEEELDRLILERSRLKAEVRELARLRELVRLEPPEPWDAEGARIIAHRMGPQAALMTMLVDKGFASGVVDNAPAITPHGVVGRILRHSAHASTILLLTDPNSRIAVRGDTSRTTGILVGKGPDQDLEVLYVPLNSPLEEGELLVTSGLAEIFPPGLPVARVTHIERSDISLFQQVAAEPLVNLRDLEEVLLLHKAQPAGLVAPDSPEAESRDGAAPAPDAPPVAPAETVPAEDVIRDAVAVDAQPQPVASTPGATQPPPPAE